MTDIELKQLIHQVVKDLYKDSEFMQLYTTKLYHTVNDQLNCPFNSCAELTQSRNLNVHMDLEKDIYDILPINITWTADQLINMIKTVYFTVAALDRVISAGKKKNRIFQTSGKDYYLLEEVGVWDFKNILVGQPLYLCLMNPKTNHKVDLNIGLKAVHGYGWMNWPMRVLIVDESTGRNIPCDFIHCLGDINFTSIQKALTTILD